MIDLESTGSPNEKSHDNTQIDRFGKGWPATRDCNRRKKIAKRSICKLKCLVERLLELNKFEHKERRKMVVIPIVNLHQPVPS